MHIHIHYKKTPLHVLKSEVDQKEHYSSAN